MIRIKPDELIVWSQYIHSISGIHLDQSKAYLYETRLSSLIAELKLASFSELFFKARSDLSKGLQRRIIDLMTTGETLFFRDTAPFELLQFKILPDLVDRRTKMNPPGRNIPIRIWCAASSTGQEIYSIAIVLKELLVDLNRYDIRLIGTDISDQAVALASKGIYNKIEIERGLPGDKLHRYFESQPTTGTWKIRDEIRGMASFRKLNLMEDFGSLGKFDIVFCRNVAIYFKDQDRTSLFNRIGKVLEPDGYLIIGSTESLSGICPQFESKRYMRSIFYQFKNTA